MVQNVRILHVSRKFPESIYRPPLARQLKAFHLRSDSVPRPQALPALNVHAQQSSVATGVLSPEVSSTSMLCACS